MKHNRDFALSDILDHEGGWADYAWDTPTNYGVTIETLRSLGMDLDSDGDVDISDLRMMTKVDARKVFQTYYWDAIKADELPDGVDLLLSHIAVMSGPARAIRFLQRRVGAKDDGLIGPETLSKALGVNDLLGLIINLHDSYLRYLQNLSKWKEAGTGWKRRIDEVLEDALVIASEPRLFPPVEDQVSPEPTTISWSLFSRRPDLPKTSNGLFIYPRFQDFPWVEGRWPNFTPSEFDCKGTGTIALDLRTLDMLQELRTAMNKPLYIVSAYRSHSHNKAVGGAKGSKHMQGIAFDIRSRGLEVNDLLSKAERIGFGGIGRYASFSHIDNRGHRARW